MLIMHRLGLSMLLSLRISGETTGAIVAEQNQVTLITEGSAGMPLSDPAVALSSGLARQKAPVMIATGQGR